MKMQLHLNGDLFNEWHIEDSEFTKDPEYGFRFRAEFNAAVIDYHRSLMHSMFYKQIAKVKRFDLYLIIESKMNNDVHTYQEYPETEGKA